MRLICPNCGAQYEVPEEVIPETGRDVQCSNCGDTWFQNHPDHPEQEPLPQPAPDLDQQDEQNVTWDSPEQEVEGTALDHTPAPEPEPEPEQESEPDHPPEPEVASKDEDRPEDDSGTSEPPRRQLDPAIADVLREEAEHEQEARAAESGGLETQPDLGLSQDPEDDDRRTREARARMARLRGEPEDQTPASVPDAEDIDPSSRRNLLPDIDEINSSLDAGPATPKHETPEAETRHEPTYAPPKRSGFRRGFAFAVLLGAILLAVYAFAPEITEAVPALAGPLEFYVETANQLRGLIDEQFGWLREWLRNMSSPANGA
jgi:predicted Zn finger-like uncharacterized protein